MREMFLPGAMHCVFQHLAVRGTFEGLERPKKPLFAAEFHRLMSPARIDIIADSSITVAERISDYLDCLDVPVPSNQVRLSECKT